MTNIDVKKIARKYGTSMTSEEMAFYFIVKKLSRRQKRKLKVALDELKWLVDKRSHMFSLKWLIETEEEELKADPDNAYLKKTIASDKKKLKKIKEELE